ncbi:MAG: nucleotide-binding protein [Deltaproteobacteria bacterium]|nr:nucleotide-binding protein [Deltaproteobacteria bacterium]
MSRNKNVFLIHRKGCPLQRRVRAFLEDAGLRPILLPSKEHPEETVVERFENYASNAYVIVLLTAAGKDRKLAPPGANLLFQLGYLAGRLGRRQVTSIYEEDLQLPAECNEVLCIPMDEIGIWKFALTRDLEVAGFEMDRQLAV